jgi:subtilisin family serine protease
MVELDTVEPIADLTPEWAWGGATGEGVRVAIIDSGIDVTHPDLAGRVETEGARVEIASGGRARIVVGPHDDSFGHGTACAGIIHAQAPAARITSVKVLGGDLAGTAEVFHAGLRWAVDQGFDVINLSLGCRKRDWALAFHELCDRAYFGGTFLVTAANNVEQVTYPSLFASVASVAANLSSDPMRFHHNPEPPTEFLARGIDVEVPWLGHGRVVTTGNSFAAPHLAGIAALIKSKHPELRPFQLKTVLWATSANVQEAAAADERRAGRLSRMMRTGAPAAAQSPR